VTAVFSTPGQGASLGAQPTTIAATQGVQLKSLSRSLLSQCPNPSAAPLAHWLNIPVMPQATAGQVVQTLIGPYYFFQAPVTPGQVNACYQDALQGPDWRIAAETTGALEFAGLGQAGAQLLFIVSGPGTGGGLIVAINVTNPVGFPILQPEAAGRMLGFSHALPAHPAV
jgi:hypothetical protein